MRSVAVRRADLRDTGGLGDLFVAYLRFYGISVDDAEARRYLRERIEAGDSSAFVAHAGGEPIGFAHCYPTWSSLDLARIWTLEDLYVAEPHRRQGVARALLAAVCDAAGAAGAVAVTLETAHSNHSARALYQQAGFVRDEQFATYRRDLTD